MSELSTTTGVPVPTLKYYLREGLLHGGERTSPNQARYDSSHVARVRLIRALIDVGDLPVARAAEVLAAMERPELELSHIFGIAQRSVTERPGADLPTTPTEESREPSRGERRIAELCARRGWRVHGDNPGLAMATRVLDAYEALDQPHLIAALDDYAEAAERIAAADLATVAAAGERTRGDRAAMANVVVIGTVLGDTLAAGLRRIAQEVESYRLFPDGGTETRRADRQDPSC
ncbi:MerR family transcriptional regulator [Microcella alkalica]|uniref:DNA-binding transcriptional MerR regulator n=1 Tax=Microcella alkalica TaxID=355930 RepID=A0A839E8M5_9MICO|nr:MerR family transcriptional regulator [Microcella alkalica]MBA8846554.1 DNA-binding transcriptional MerR regulator [Microcella alkalica]